MILFEGSGELVGELARLLSPYSFPGSIDKELAAFSRSHQCIHLA
jgi:hypothetical protein